MTALLLNLLMSVLLLVPATKDGDPPVTWPSSCKAETRRDGLLLTFNHPLGDNLADHSISLSLNPASTRIASPPRIEGVVKSPDGHRVFFHVPTHVQGTGLDLTINASNWPHPIKTRIDSSTPHLDSRGPDFAGSIHPVRPILDRKPPANAVVLFDGTNLDQLIKRNDGGKPDWTIEDDELVVKRGSGDLLSRLPLSDGLYHIEWMSPPGGVPESQLNGNSGIKFEERYELQILNTPGRADQTTEQEPPKFNEAGGIYRLRAPDVNASNGAGEWQTYHVWYTAPRWEDGRKIADARMTVYWNDVLVHDDAALPTKTGASIEEGPDPKRLLLQDHASSTKDQVRFRNIWHVPAADLTPEQHPSKP